MFVIFGRWLPSVASYEGKVKERSWKSSSEVNQNTIQVGKVDVFWVV